MKKWMALSLALVLVLSGCGKKNEPAQSQPADNSQQQTTGTQQQPDDGQSSDSQTQDTPDSSAPTPEVDINDLSGDDLTTMIEDFNNPDTDPETKEQLRQQLEEIFRQADQQTAQ